MDAMKQALMNKRKGISITIDMDPASGKIAHPGASSDQGVLSDDGLAPETEKSKTNANPLNPNAPEAIFDEEGQPFRPFAGMGKAAKPDHSMNPQMPQSEMMAANGPAPKGLSAGFAAMNKGLKK